MMNLIPCGSCGYAVFPILGSFPEHCPICFWENRSRHDAAPADEARYNSNLSEYRNQWPQHARKTRQALLNDAMAQRRKVHCSPLELGPDDDELRDKGFEDCIVDREACFESCERLRPVVGALWKKFPPHLQDRLAKALGDDNSLAVLYEISWAIIKHDIILSEPLYAALAGEDTDRRVEALFARHTEKLRADIEEVARAVRPALPERGRWGYEGCLQGEKYPAAAQLLLPSVAEGTAHGRIMDRIAMRLELHGTRWEGLEERLYRLLSDLRGVITGADEWIFTNFLLHKEFFEGVEFWLWQISAMGYPLPRPVYDEFSLLAKEMGLEAFYMENIIPQGE